MNGSFRRYAKNAIGVPIAVNAKGKKMNKLVFVLALFLSSCEGDFYVVTRIDGLSECRETMPFILHYRVIRTCEGRSECVKACNKRVTIRKNPRR